MVRSGGTARLATDLSNGDRLHARLEELAIRLIERLARVIIEVTPAGLAELDPLAASRRAGLDLCFEWMEAMADAVIGCLGKP